MSFQKSRSISEDQQVFVLLITKGLMFKALVEEKPMSTKQVFCAFKQENFKLEESLDICNW
jgi:hypothetical protein